MLSFEGRDIISLKVFNREEIEYIFYVASEMERIFQARKRSNLLKDKILATLFFEPSTRTRLSHEAAMLRLGGGVLGFADPGVTRAGIGETVEDTVRTVESYADVIVIRHFSAGVAQTAADCVNIPVINAGDGTNEHPTQALTDLYTIKKEKGQIDGLKIGIIGDCYHSRAIHSLLYGLTLFEGVSLSLVSPKELRLHENIKKYLYDHNVKMSEFERPEEIISDVDVLHVGVIHRTRLKEEEFKRLVKGYYSIGLDILEKAKDDLIVLCPLPRLDNIIPTNVDSSRHAKYFQEVSYGVAVRMALLALICGAR